MNRDEGWFRWHMCPIQAKRVDVAPDAGQVDAATLLEKICDITDVAMNHLKRSIRGQGGNPERRFACWALFHGSFMTQRQIGGLLDLTPAQVAQNLNRCKKDSEQLLQWKEQWLQQYPEKVSIVIPEKKVSEIC